MNKPKVIQVVCAIILDDEDRVFLARRKKGKHLSGYWEFPGGKVEKEAEEEALQRELKEELDMEVDRMQFFMEHVHAYPKLCICLRAYTCHCRNQPQKMTDHDRIEWVARPSLLGYKLSPADIPIAREFVEFIK